MSLPIVWLPESIETFNDNLLYLEEQWTNQVINTFLDRVEEVLERIAENPALYPVYRKEEQIHRCVVNEHISLYYRIKENQIDLLTFWNAHQNPKRLKI